MKFKPALRACIIGLWMATTLTAPVNSRRGSDGDTSDRADRVADDAARAAERAERDDRDAIKDQTDAAERAAKDSQDAAEDAADDAKDAAEDAAEDAADDAKDAAEDAADDAKDAAEDAAKAAEDATDHSGSGSSQEMQDLAKSEDPAYDRRGYPVRRGEIVAMDMNSKALSNAEKAGFQVIARTRLDSLDSEVVRLSVPKGMDGETALQRMKAIDANASYDFTHYYGLQFTPQGARGATKSAMRNTKVGNLRVGMVDTAVGSHNLLAATRVEQHDFGSGKAASPMEHGTAIASLLANKGASHIFAANIFRGGASAPYTSADKIVSALDWLVGKNVSVINMSLAGPRNAILDKLIGRVSARGFVVVAAAGNGGPSAPPAYPAALKDVIAVTAVDRNMHVYRYANQGGYITVAALGVDISAADIKGGTASFSGTSFATTHIAAWFAGCMNSASSEGRRTCIIRMKKVLKDLGKPGPDSVYGFGYLA